MIYKWAHSKPRRSVRTVDLEEEWSKQADENDEDDMSTVLANVKRSESHSSVFDG